jgi:acyl-CoA synthetase (NDP forming)
MSANHSSTRSEALMRLATPARLRSFFAPKTVALVGASESSAWARNVHHGLKLTGRQDGIVVINPNRKDVFGCPTHASLGELGAPVDLAYLFVGPDNVEPVMREAAAIGVKNVVILAAGFSEAGEEGLARQRSLVERAIELDMTALGPNSLGFVNPSAAAPYGSGLKGPLLSGPVGLVLQSGSLTSALIPFATGRGIGCSLLAAVGNEAVISSMDVFELLIEDERTRSIAMFLETLREPARFRQLCMRALHAGKPVVVLKAGRSEAGKRAAMAHTGALASDDAVVDSVMRQCGVVRVSGLEEMVVTAGLLGYQQRLPQGRRLGVVTSSGGGSNLIADKGAESGFSLPALSEATAASLRAVLPPFASVQNPLDVTGFWMNTGGAGQVLKPEDDALMKVSRDPSMDLVVHVMTALPNEKPADPAPVEARIHALAREMREAPVPTFTLTLANLPLEPYPRDLLAAAGIHLLPGVDLGLTAIDHATRWNEQRASILADPDAPATSTRPLTVRVAPGTWSEWEARQWFQSQGVPFVPAELVKTAAEAVGAAEKAGWPAVLKLCSREVPHKSDVGGVALRLADAEAVRLAFDRVSRAGAGKQVDGVLVSPMRAQGVELLLGVTMDPTFGPTLTVGLGGIWVELLKDVAIRALPLTRPQIRAMLGELRGVSLLEGARGGVAADLDKVVDTIFRFAEAALSLGDALEAAEINPLLVNAGQVEALDALVITRVR